MIKIVHELRKARGSNAKLSILRKHKDNKLWLNVLVATYNKSINYYTGPPNDMTFVDEVESYTGMFKGLNDLRNREYTGNLARDFATELSEDYGEIVRLILGGSIRAGISTTSINKVYPGLIPTFDVMLAKDAEIRSFPVLASTKYDGIRVIVSVDDGHVIAQTRAGKKLRVSSLLHNMAKQPNGVYDGELVSGDGKQVERTSITSSVNKCLKGTATDIDNYTFCIFDKLTIGEWFYSQCDRPYLTRLQELNETLVPVQHVNAVDQYNMLTQDDVTSMFEHRLANGYEGIIVRYPTDPYVWKRSEALIKLKAIKECILKCVGAEEGKGKYEGMIGALICEGTVGDTSVRVKVGAGLSDFDRDKSPDEYKGKRIEVIYNDVVKAKNADYYSLFLPRYKRIVGDTDV